MAAMDFPSAPTVGQIYTPAGGGPTYIWSGTAWSQIGQAGVFKLGSGTLAAAAASIDIPMPGAGFHTLEVLLKDMLPVTDNSQPGHRFSFDGGASFLSANYMAGWNTISSAGVNTPTGYSGGGGVTLALAQSYNAGTPAFFRLQFPQHNVGNVVQNVLYDGMYWSGTNYCRVNGMGTQSGTSGMANAIRLYYGNGSNYLAGLKWQVMGYK